MKTETGARGAAFLLLGGGYEALLVIGSDVCNALGGRLHRGCRVLRARSTASGARGGLWCGAGAGVRVGHRLLGLARRTLRVGARSLGTPAAAALGLDPRLLGGPSQPLPLP